MSRGEALDAVDAAVRSVRDAGTGRYRASRRFGGPTFSVEHSDDGAWDHAAGLREVHVRMALNGRPYSRRRPVPSAPWGRGAGRCATAPRPS